MKHSSLFSGIGGFDLAAEWMGWENVFHCEWMPFPRQVLKYHFPNSISYEDITKTDFTIHRGQLDILTGGFPCQPYSVAGKRLGKEDERHLWPEMLRAIREIEPRFVVGENVRGLVNWNGGMVFDEVQSDLENEGYEVIPFILPACAVGAPHRRDRIWFVAHTNNKRRSDGCGKISEADGEISKRNESTEPCDSNTWNASNTNNQGLERGAGKRVQRNERRGNEFFNAKSSGDCKQNSWQNFPTQSPICSGDDGLPTKLDGITFSKWRNESIKGYGNAVVPQLVYKIFKAIEQSDYEY